jgi:hypothetical protein
MKAYLDCIPCFLRQSLEAARMVTPKEEIHAKVLEAVMSYLQHTSFNKTPPELSKHVHETVKKITNCQDPYQKAKKRDNALARKLYPTAKQMIANSADSLLIAIKLAIAGNIIDFAVSNRFDIEKTIDRALKADFAIDHYKYFKEAMKKTKQILYIGDNAGEVFFDKLLLGQLIKLGKQIIYAVREKPIINDATLKDARFAGLDKIAKVITIGGGAPGVVLRLCSSDFIDYYKHADLVIAKGQGNYESLSQESICFLLMVKCELVAKDLGVNVGDMVLKMGGKK